MIDWPSFVQGFIAGLATVVLLSYAAVYYLDRDDDE